MSVSSQDEPHDQLCRRSRSRFRCRRIFKSRRVACQVAVCVRRPSCLFKMLTVHFYPPVLHGAFNNTGNQWCNQFTELSMSRFSVSKSLLLKWVHAVAAVDNCLFVVLRNAECVFSLGLFFFCVGWCEQFWGGFCSPSAFEPVQTQRPV